MQGLLTQGRGNNDALAQDLALTGSSFLHEKLQTHPLSKVFGYVYGSRALEWHVYASVRTGQAIGANVRGTEEICVSGDFLSILCNAIAGKDLLALGQATGTMAATNLLDGIKDLPAFGSSLLKEAKDSLPLTLTTPTIAVIASFRDSRFLASHISSVDATRIFTPPAFEGLITLHKNLDTRVLVIVDCGATVHFANIPASLISQLTVPQSSGWDVELNPG
jgi:hypothetical protein